MNDRIELSVDNAIATMTLSRADKMNALDPAMFEAIIAAIDALHADTSIRVVVLTGAGEHFSAGLDVASFAADGGSAMLQRLQPLPGTDANFYQQPALGLIRLPVPVIAAMSGVVYGGGLQIAMGADIRIAAPDARLSVMELKWGIIPDMGMSVTARHVVRADCLKRLALTADVVSAADAQRYGFVTDIADDPLAAAHTLAATIAERSPDAVAATKSLFARTLEADAATALQDEANTQLTVLGKANQLEAVAANFEKRPPNFAARSS